MHMPTWPEVHIIRKRRINLKITQKQIAELSGVPQSIISRIESGAIADPSYNTIKNLITALEKIEEENTRGDYGKVKSSPKISARHVMNPNVISVKPLQSITEAWNIMKKRDFSQLPVMDDKGRILGGITGPSFLSAGLGKRETDMKIGGKEENEPWQVPNGKVEDFMSDEIFPLVGKDAELNLLVHLLKKASAVLVLERGKVVGIITSYDLMENVVLKNPSRLL